MSDSLLAVIIIITFINSHVVFRKSEKRSSIDSVNQHMNSLCSKIKKLFFLLSQPAIACTKLTIETLEQGVKYVQS